MQVFRSPVIEEGTASRVLAFGISERVARMRNDLSLDLPVLLQDDKSSPLVVMIGAETADRMAVLCAFDDAELVRTGRRAAMVGMAAERDFCIGAHLRHRPKVTCIRLKTNSPAASGQLMP